MNLIRWISLIPACVLTWCAAVFFGLHGLGVIEWYCPPNQMVSGHCIAWWVPYAERVVIVSTVGLSAFMVVICATVIAPEMRLVVAWIAYFFGMCVALYVWSQTDATAEFRAAAVAIFIAAFSITKFLGVRILQSIFDVFEESFDDTEPQPPFIDSNENH